MKIQLESMNAIGVVDTYGGELISYIPHQGYDYLWSGDQNSWLGRSPHLFPIVGAINNNTYRHADTIYQMKKHGFARISEFAIVKQTKDSITLCLSSNEETRLAYPFEFEFYVTHTLVDGGFETSYEVKNTDKVDIPFCIGGHVGFRCPIDPTHSFSDYQLDFDKPLTQNALVGTTDDPLARESAIPFLDDQQSISLTHTMFDNGALLLEGIDSHCITLAHKSGKPAIQFEYSDFPILALWTMPYKEAPYLCLEPWHGLPTLTTDDDTLHNKPYAILLPPSSSKTFQYTARIL